MGQVGLEEFMRLFEQPVILNEMGAIKDASDNVRQELAEILKRGTEDLPGEHFLEGAGGVQRKDSKKQKKDAPAATSAMPTEDVERMKRIQRKMAKPVDTAANYSTILIFGVCFFGVFFQVTTLANFYQ